MRTRAERSRRRLDISSPRLECSLANHSKPGRRKKTCGNESIANLYSKMPKLCILLQDNTLQPANIEILYSHAVIKGDVKYHPVLPTSCRAVTPFVQPLSSLMHRCSHELIRYQRTSLMVLHRSAPHRCRHRHHRQMRTLPSSSLWQLCAPGEH